MRIKPVLSRKQNIALRALVWCEVVASAHGKRLGDFSAGYAETTCNLLAWRTVLRPRTDVRQHRNNNQSQSIYIMFLLGVTGALPPYPHELFVKSSCKNFIP